MTLSLSRRAALWEDRTAVVDVDADRRVSYADLESEADAMARRLSALGVGPGDAVGVVSRNRVETLALLFAVRRLGAIFAPISHRLTPATVEGPLETIDPEVVAHEEAQRDLVRSLPDERTHSFEDVGRHEGSDYERIERDPEDALLYLHTDEGERVVEFPARAVEWNCITATAAWGLGRGDCAPTLLPLSDAGGLLGLALPLLYVGGRSVVLRAFDPEDALASVADEEATVLLGGATEYRELVESDDFGEAGLGSVEWVASRSALADDARDELARRAPVVRTYGGVETGPNNLYVPPERDDDAESATADRVGRPFPDCEVRVAGGEGEAEKAPDAEIGELQFRGPVTPRGYLAEEGGTDEFPEWVSAGDRGYRDEGEYYLSGDERSDKD
ncbi:class I adenylate-forming enzyme family protein [Halorussus lipolyticus]|uniref:class I adenylate-forming enzyme family protein n=1 Tax=Halorussus lipolyticus TaxID=3034024 RepID=UPI0023E7EE9E|nr:AMP-binding protein [Halorussus sp. DT80]